AHPANRRCKGATNFHHNAAAVSAAKPTGAMRLPHLPLLLLLLCAALLGGSADRSRSLPQDAYVWQRHWTSELSASMQSSAELLRSWRVLAAETDAGGHLATVAIDPLVLSASARPAIPVIRIDGQLAGRDEETLLTETRAVLEEWRRHVGPIS